MLARIVVHVVGWLLRQRMIHRQCQLELNMIGPQCPLPMRSMNLLQRTTGPDEFFLDMSVDGPLSLSQGTSNSFPL